MSNPPFTKKCHVQIIKSIAEGMQAAGTLHSYLELGVKSGTCFNQVAPFAERAYAVDIKDAHHAIKQNENLVWFHGTTDDFFEKFCQTYSYFDLIFIDADHRHIPSLKDFSNSFLHLKDNGIICMHDTYPPSEKYAGDHYCYDSWKTAEVIKEEYSGYCEIVTLPFYYGVSIIRKAHKQLMWREE